MGQVVSVGWEVGDREVMGGTGGGHALTAFAAPHRLPHTKAYRSREQASIEEKFSSAFQHLSPWTPSFSL